MFFKPSFKDSFGPEIRQNLINRYGTRFSDEDARKEGFYYALDMCIEFQKKSDGLLTSDWIEHISNEVYVAMTEYVFPLDFSSKDFISEVKLESSDLSHAKRLVDTYYQRY